MAESGAAAFTNQASNLPTTRFGDTIRWQKAMIFRNIRTGETLAERLCHATLINYKSVDVHATLAVFPFETGHYRLLPTAVAGIVPISSGVVCSFDEIRPYNYVAKAMPSAAGLTPIDQTEIVPKEDSILKGAEIDVVWKDGYAKGHVTSETATNSNVFMLSIPKANVSSESPIELERLAGCLAIGLKHSKALVFGTVISWTESTESYDCTCSRLHLFLS